jgi:hypothetical protein
VWLYTIEEHTEVLIVVEFSSMNSAAEARASGRLRSQRWTVL